MASDLSKLLTTLQKKKKKIQTIDGHDIINYQLNNKLSEYVIIIFQKHY